MKKKLLFLFLLIFSVLALTYYFYFNSSHNQKNSSVYSYIPADAPIVIVVDFRQVQNIIIKEILSNPLDLFTQSDSSKNYEEIEDILFKIPKAGIDLKQKIIFYKSSDSTVTNWASLVQLKDSSKFRKVFEPVFAKHHFKTFSDHSFYSDSLKFFIAYNAELIFFRYGKLGEIKDSWQNIASTDSLHQHTSVPKLKDATSTCFVWIKENSFAKNIFETTPEMLVEVNFGNGEMLIETTFTDKYDWFKKVVSQQEIEDTSTIYLSTNFTDLTFINQLLNKKAKYRLDSVFRIINLNSTDVINFSNGKLDYVLQGNINEIETHVTYEYDDNFEKKEKKVQNITTYPDYVFVYGLNSIKFKEKLISENRLLEKNNQLLFPNPFHEAYCYSESDKLVVTPQANFPQLPLNLNYPLYFQLDIKKYIKQFQLPQKIDKDKLQNIEKITLTILNTEEEEYKVDLKITLSDKKSNAAISLFRLLE